MRASRRTAPRRFAALALAVATLAGCTKVGTQSAGGGGGNPWTHHGRLVIASAADPKNLDPVLAAQVPTLDLGFFIFSWAVRYDDKAAAASRRPASRFRRSRTATSVATA